MLFANNCNTTLNGGITAIATSMVVTSATGFPSPTGSQYFYCTLADAATQTTIEIVKVTAVSGTTFTIVRGQDGTTGTIFASGAVVSLRLVAASLNDFPKLDEANTFSGPSSTFTNAPIFSSALLVNSGGTGLTTLTAGYIPYGNGTSAFSSSVNLQFNGSQLGIGGAPATTLDVTGTIRATGNVSPSSGSGLESIFAGGASYLVSYNRTTPAFLPINIQASNIYLQPNGANALAVFASGGVSIGNTTDPGATNLSVTGSATIQGLTVGRGGGAVASTTSVGANAGFANTTGSENAFFGYYAAATNQGGTNNSAYGSQALYLNVNGIKNSAFGNVALYSNTGSYNTGIGTESLYSNSSGTYVTALGYQSGRLNTTTSYGTYIGAQAGYSTTGTSNQFFGQGAGYYVTSGSYNTIIGTYTGSTAPISATGSNYVVLSDGQGNIKLTAFPTGGVSIGNTTDPGATNLSVTGSITGGSLSGPHNGTVGATTPNTGAFTTLSASSTVSGAGFSTYLASPPAIGGTAAAAGSFTSLTATSVGTAGVLAKNGGLTSVTAVAGSLTLATGGVTLASQAMASTSTWRIRAYGTYVASSSATARTLTMRCYWGSTALTAVTTGNVLASTAQTTPWQVELEITGSSATAAWCTAVLSAQVTSATIPLNYIATAASVTGLTTTSTLDFRVGQTGTAVAGDTINVHSVTIERIV